MQRRSIRLLSLVLLSLASLGACTSQWRGDSDKGGPGPLRIARTYWPPYALAALAEREGMFKRNGTSVEMKVFTELGDARRAFERGAVDASMMTTYEVLLTREAGADPVILMLVDYSNGSDGVIAKPSIKSLSELKGKVVGVDVGTIGHFVLNQALKRVGLAETDVKILNISTSNVALAFRQGKVDAASMWDPEMGRLVADGAANLLFTSREIPRKVTDVLVVERSKFENKRDAWVGFARAWFSALELHARDTDRSIRTIAESDKTTPEELKRTFASVHLTGKVDNGRFLGIEGGAADVANLREMQDFMVKQGLLRSAADPALFFAEGWLKGKLEDVQ